MIETNISWVLCLNETAAFYKILLYVLSITHHPSPFLVVSHLFSLMLPKYFRYSPVQAMGPSLKHGKYVESSISGDGLDRISRLPDELLCLILSFLPTRCAVCTSILSKRWRYLFTLTDSLSFDDAPWFGGLEEDDAHGFKRKRGKKGALRKRFGKFRGFKVEAARRKRFKKFVYEVFGLCQVSPIKKFSLVCQDKYSDSDLNAWVSTAVRKGVQELHFQAPMPYGVGPDGLFICETLVRLKIIGCKGNALRFPSSPSLPRLKILHLEYLKIYDYDSVETLLSSCQLLEALTLKFCKCYVRGFVLSSGLLNVLTIEGCSFKSGLIEIDAPDLAYLTISSNTGVKIVPSWKYSFSLVKAELTFNYRAEGNHDKTAFENDRGLITAAACKTTTLHLLSDSIEVLLTAGDYEQMPDFSSLSTLHLGYCPYYAWKYITSLLDKSPRLETIIFEQGLHRCYRYPVSVSHLNEALIPFLSNVKEIEVHCFSGTEHSMLFLGHLLKNAGVLKRLILRKCHTVDVEEELQISEVLSTLPRASKDCGISLK